MPYTMMPYDRAAFHAFRSEDRDEGKARVEERDWVGKEPAAVVGIESGHKEKRGDVHFYHVKSMQPPGAHGRGPPAALSASVPLHWFFFASSHTGPVDLRLDRLT